MKRFKFAGFALFAILLASCGGDGNQTIPTDGTKIIGEHAGFFSVTNDGAELSYKEDNNGISEQKFILKVPLILEERLDLGEHGGLALPGMTVQIIGEDGDPITDHDFDFGMDLLDTAVDDEFKTFLNSKPGTEWIAPFNLTIHNKDLASDLKGRFKNAKGIRVVNVKFVNVDIPTFSPSSVKEVVSEYAAPENYDESMREAQDEWDRAVQKAQDEMDRAFEEAQNEFGF